ncbi:TetR/AcrR family transcriptional regulator [Streptomyces aureocirculatus]|uniref:TetR/AcrR family transcriptional regulator n=1 Tax=Streptomyces aureocirculatus TaxID=67275 RepID=UPI0004C634E8|nr:TetR/AcrR family transcriptional regulator [Streptomyces aureocirculatus]
MATDRLTDVLDATYTCLTRYGVRRTTVDDIASEMGVSRSAVYQYVRGKDDAVRQLARRLHDRALERAETAAVSDAPTAERVHGILAAKLDLVLDLVGGSPHTAELVDTKARLSGDICDAFTERVRALLTAQFAAAGVREASDVTPARAADICLALVIGLESTPDAANLLRPATNALLTGLLPAPTATPVRNS